MCGVIITQFAHQFHVSGELSFPVVVGDGGGGGAVIVDLDLMILRTRIAYAN